MFLTENGKKVEKQGKEAIHSGQFMVSHFEAEAQDDDEIAVPIPDIPLKDSFEKTIKPILYNSKLDGQLDVRRFQPIGIETSLSKLFQCMSIAYRQKLTSPKWNRFRGIRLRWKDKIRLNNVIWRCWHMQFIKKQNTLICQFASPLDVDTHNKPEAIVMEGKYWKRKLEAVTAEYKKWRMFYKNQSFGYIKDANDLEFIELELRNYFNIACVVVFTAHEAGASVPITNNKQKHLFTKLCKLEMELMKCELSNSEADGMLIDEDYMGLMSDTLFSTITNHPFAFPDTRELAKAGLADFIQPSLGPLQPNLPNNDFMDTIEHLDLLSGKLPTVPEENGSDVIYNKSLGWDYSELMSVGPPLQLSAQNIMEQYQQLPVSMNSVPIQSNRQTLVQYDNEIMMQPTVDAYISRQPQTYQSPVISSKSSKQMKDLPPSQVKPNTSSLGSTVFSKSLETVYCNYSLNNIESNISVTDPLRIDNQDEYKLLQNTKTNQQSSQNFRGTPQVSSTKYASQMAESYKLPPGSHVSSHGTSMITNQQAKPQLKDDKSSNKTRNSNRGRRSRSNTREPLKRPPLQTAVSDPSLITPVNSMILSQLLTNDSDSVYQRHTQSLSSTQDSNIRCKEETTQTLCILPHTLQTGAVIISPVNVNSVQKTDVLLPSTLTPTSPHVETSSQSLSSPTSPQGSTESPSRDPAQKEQRRSHIHAEQKRRYNIKNGFDMIHSLIPHLNQNPNAKLSKAAMLQKSAEYIMQLRTERDQLKDEMDSLRQQIENLNTSISNCQSLLPATGAPVSRKREIKMQEMFDEYVRTRTMENWKFWIFSLLFKPLLGSFNNFVSTANLTELYRTTCQWAEQHCTLGDLRPVVFNSLKYLCTKTDILTNPDQLPEEAKKQVISGPNLPNEL